VGGIVDFIEETGSNDLLRRASISCYLERMTIIRRLSDEEFKSYIAGPMTNVTAHMNVAVEIWPYVNALDLDELGVPSINDVRYLYQDASGWFDHVLIGTSRFNALVARQTSWIDFQHGRSAFVVPRPPLSASILFRSLRLPRRWCARDACSNAFPG
jgi:hypothetical protein